MDVQCDEGFRAVTSRDLKSDQTDFIPVRGVERCTPFLSQARLLQCLHVF
jgi:hypothetical protein